MSTSTAAIDAALMEGIDAFETLAETIGSEGEWTPELIATVRKAARDTADAFERALVATLITSADYVHVDTMAEASGISRMTLYRRIKQSTAPTENEPA